MKVLTVDYNSPDAPELFCKSLKETGFGVLSYHPISTKLIDETYKQWEEFFKSDDKIKYRPEKDMQDGYFPFGTEHAKGNSVMDLKEFYHYYPAGRKPAETAEISAKIYAELNSLGVELLQWVEDFLPKHISKQLSMPLRNMITSSPNTLLRVLHYPPIEEAHADGAVRAAAHEDINMLTLLPAATQPGLEVKDVNGNWHKVPCDQGNIVVNVGDMLQMCTRHYFKSTTHRVVNPDDHNKTQSRYSMPLFLHARPEVRLNEQYTVIDYLNERLLEIGIY